CVGRGSKHVVWPSAASKKPSRPCLRARGRGEGGARREAMSDNGRGTRAKPPVAIQPRDAARWCDQAIGKQMAGHSQFKNIMHRKGRQDAAKAKVFAKLAREITVAAKAGLPDPDMNSRLRLAIQ